MEETKIIGIDIDNTIFSCRSFLYNFAANLKFSSTNRKLKFSEVPFTENFKKTPLLFKIFPFFNSKNYKESVDAIQVINKLHDEGYQIYLITSRPNFSAFRTTLQEWFAEKGLKYDKLIMGCNNKPLFLYQNSIDLLIDDQASTCLEVEKMGIKSIQFQGFVKQKENKLKINQSKNMSSSWSLIKEQISQIFNEEENEI